MTKNISSFILHDYDQKKPFTSFLPGIAGLEGIPLWSFYVNRGQGICSFGVDSKNCPIMEFFPANQAYQYVETYGFRTFIQANSYPVMECFKTGSENSIKRRMIIEHHGFSIEEVNEDLGLKVLVSYFLLPNENLGALVRKVKFESIKDTINIRVLDGIANILPYGVENSPYKEMSNLMKSWMEVTNLNEKVPFFKVRTSMSDSVEVSLVTKGHFYFSFLEDMKLINPIVDIPLIFGQNTSLSEAWNFDNLNFNGELHTQYPVNKVPCAFSPFETKLEPEKPQTLVTVIGHVSSVDLIMDKIKSIATHDYITHKENESKKIIEDMFECIRTQTDIKEFDNYINQSFLDNALRGGFPVQLTGNKKEFTYYVYGRKHGDPEREYNFFRLSPEFYSNGEGNFRDVNQNRRCDVLFHPGLGTQNIKTFMNLIQLDGYNPLIVENRVFRIEPDTDVDLLIDKHLASKKDIFKNFFKGTYTPGHLAMLIDENVSNFTTDGKSFMKDVIDSSEAVEHARHGEGFWVDHFTYNLDLVESYLKIFPDKLEHLLIKDKSYRFYNSPERVLPSSMKTYLTQDGKVRQYGAVVKDKEKIEKFGPPSEDNYWVKTQNGHGKIYNTSLFVKILALSIIKMASLDPEGMGIEMDANKPGWNDALNGLPGLMGSGLSETIETKRLIKFLSDSISSLGNFAIDLPVELEYLLNGINELLSTDQSGDYDYWRQSSFLRETYREKTRFGLIGDEKRLDSSVIEKILFKMTKKLEAGILKAKSLGDGLLPSFFRYEAAKYEILENKEFENNSYMHLKRVTVKEFTCHPLPEFLEAPARYLKTNPGLEISKSVHDKVMSSGIYDKKLKMLKTSASIDSQNHEIGRLRAFTPGWLERESVFLHMTYKYLLGLLEAGLYQEFFELMKTNFVPFMNPDIYGRSILENSSFIASSVNPDPNVHGQGFVSRLSGSNAEVLNIWYTMMIGHRGFYYDKELKIEFKPILSEDFFEKSGEISFKFLGHTKITYYFPGKKKTFGKDGVKAYKIKLFKNGIPYEINQGFLNEPISLELRDGCFERLEVYFI